MGDVTDSVGTGFTGGGNNTEKCGMGFTSKLAGKIIKVTKTSVCTATKAYIYSGDATTIGTMLDSSTFSGDEATFSKSMANATFYWILCDANGGSYVSDEGPYSSGRGSTNVTWQANWHEWGGGGFGNANFLRGIQSVTTNDTSDIIVTPTALVLSTDEPAVNIKIHAKPLSLGASLVLGNVNIVIVNSPIPTYSHGQKEIKRSWNYPDADILNLIPEERSLITSAWR